LKTGDQFILQENGYGKVVGRLKEMLIRGGENLFPREIEDFLNTHPNINETHVVSLFVRF
jgi:medium-chain acyl-CoA ligase, mitochondrial